MKNFILPNLSLSKTFKRDDSDWTAIQITYPYVFVGEEYGGFGDTYRVLKINAPTLIQFKSNFGFHCFTFQVLGFGITYSKQWDY